MALGGLFLIIVIFALVWYLLEELYDRLDNLF